MKKRVLALILCAATAFNLTACGSKGEAAEATEAVENTESTQDDAVAVNLAKYDLNGEDYVTLCDYSEIPVTISGDYDVTDNDVLDYVEQIFTQGGPFYTADPSKTKVEEGDIVNVDYVGKLDGEAFEGGSAENQNIDVYANASAGGTGYIDGFTDAASIAEPYREAVAWGVENGVIAGYEDSTFRPNNACARWAVAVLLQRALDVAEE